MTAILQALIPINPSGADPASAAAYLAWVAYPDPKQKAARDRFFRSVAASHFKVNGKHPPPSLRGIKRDKILGGIRPGLNRITTRRIPAVVMAFRQMGLDPAKGRLGLNESARAYADSEAMTDEKDGGLKACNVRKDVWRDSRAALAMKMALPLHLLDSEGRRHPIDLLQCGAWVPQAIQDARHLVPVIQSFFSFPMLIVPEST